MGRYGGVWWYKGAKRCVVVVRQVAGSRQVVVVQAVCGARQRVAKGRQVCRHARCGRCVWCGVVAGVCRQGRHAGRQHRQAGR